MVSGTPKWLIHPRNRGGRAIGGGYARERDGLRPPCRAVHNGKKVGEAMRRGKGPNQVYVNVGETTVRDGDGGGTDHSVAVNL
jgi:hypothetical protein